MLFKKAQAETCVVCGEAIAASDSRFVEKKAGTNAALHRHIRCDPEAGLANAPVRTTPCLPGVETAAVQGQRS